MLLFFAGLFFGPILLILFTFDVLYTLIVCYPRPNADRYFDLFRSGWFLSGFFVSLSVIMAVILIIKFT